MAPLSDAQLVTLAEIYIVANTPTFLIERLKNSAPVLQLAGQESTASLLGIVDTVECSSWPRFRGGWCSGARMVTVQIG